MESLTVSRRQILTLAGLTLGAGVVELGMAGAAAAAPNGDVVLEPIADDPVAVLSGDGAAPAAVPRQLAVRVLRTIDLPVGTLLAITFDSRVHAPLASAVIVHQGRPVPASKTLVTDPVTGLHTSTITLTEPVHAAGELIAVVGTANPLLYPYDLVRGPAAPSARVRPARAAEARRTLQPARPSSFGGPAQPWGVELDGVWAPRSWGVDGKYRYYVPVRVSLRSVGPGRAPATSFSVSVDPRLVREVTVESAQLNNRAYGKRIRLAGRSRTASVYQTRWRVPVGLARGEVLDVYLAVTTVLPAGPLTGVKHPVVAALMAGDATARRHTGRETFSRTDSVCGDTPDG